MAKIVSLRGLPTVLMVSSVIKSTADAQDVAMDELMRVKSVIIQLGPMDARTLNTAVASVIALEEALLFATKNAKSKESLPIVRLVNIASTTAHAQHVATEK